MKPILTAAAIVILTAVPAGAQVLVDVASAGAATSGPGLTMSAGRTSANNFTLASQVTVRAASFFSLECCNVPWSGTLTYLFFTPSAGGSFVPGSTPFATGSVTSYLATTVYSDAASNVVRRFDFNLAAPLVLPGGSYFFALQAAAAPGAGSLAWRNVQGSGFSVNTTSPSFASWTLQAGEAAFQLHGSPFDITAVPEPASVALVAGGLAVLGVTVGRRRRA